MSDQAHKKVDQQIENLEKRLYKEYAQAYQEMEAKRKNFMASFEENRAKMEKRYKSGEISYSDYKSWLRGKASDASWYREMTKSLADDMNNINNMSANMINDELPEVYADNYNYGTYTVESGARIDTSFTLVDRDTVYELAQGDTRLLPNVSVDDKKDVSWNRQKFNSAIMQSVLQGESVGRSAKRLQSVVGMNYNSAVRNARTALTSAENKGRIRSYERAEDMGIKLQKQWLATLDKRTRDTHRMLDGETIDVKETFWNGLEYPGDPDGDPSEVYNCRCTLVSVIDGLDYSKNARRSNLDGESYAEWKGELSIKNMTYSEWKNYQGKPVSKAKQTQAKQQAKYQKVPEKITHNQLKDMKRSDLIPMARSIFVKQNMKDGVPMAEAERRFNLLIDANTTPQLRKYIHKHQ